MMSGELKARIEELEAVAEHVPPAVLGHRLLSCLEEHIGEGFQALNIWQQFQDLYEEETPPDAAAEEGHVGVEIPVKPEPAEAFDPAISTCAADRAAPEMEASKPERKVPEDAKIRAFHSSEPEPSEDTKVCKRCEEEKPLSAFGKHNGFKDGLDNRCKPCRSEMRRTGETSPKGSGASRIGTSHHERRLKAEATKKAEEEKIRNVTVLPPAVPVPEPEEVRGPVREKAPARFCANDEACISTAQIGRPTKLTHGNRDRRCFACQEAEIGEKDGGAMIVRHSAADQEVG